MTRRSFDSEHGFVRFPIEGDGYANSGEGGLVVFAIWRDLKTPVCCQELWMSMIGPIINPGYNKEAEETCQKQIRESFRLSRLAQKRLPIAEKYPVPKGTPLYGQYSITEIDAKRFNLPDGVFAAIHHNYYHTIRGREYDRVQGAIYLGSSGGSWYHDEKGQYFCPEYADLTEEGQSLVAMLNKLYGSEAMLISVLDT